ncbi:hypothetical protein KCU89_g7031, partial [Aureobasidium melanogenum]
MSNGSDMEIDQTSPSGAGQASSSQPSSPFNPLTFNYRDIPRSTRSVWIHDPPIEVADGNEPKTYNATSARECYRRMMTTYVSPAVKALGTDPYPGLRQRRYIPELEIHTPRYNLERPWMGKSSILQFVTPQELQRLGCINLEADDNSAFEVSPRFRVDTETLASASKDRSVMNVIGNNRDIHPCLRRSNWEGTSDAEYEYLKPVLRIVTKMMEMDGVLDLWFALGQPMQKLPQTDMLKAQKVEHRVYYTGRSTVGQRVHTKSEMKALCDYITFQWLHEDEAPGSTLTDIKKRGLRDGKRRHACDIRLDTYLLYIISGGTQLNASHYNPAASDASSYMRTQLLLANIIIHEMTHAWLPFRNDDRAGEEGFAIETVINKNVVLLEVQANISLESTPFGLFAERWPGLERREGIAIKASAAKHGIRFDTSYAVPMSYVHQFFLDDFWDNRIQRFGDGAVNNYKAVGVRKSLVGRLGYNDVESPTVKQKQNPLSGALEEDPEIDPDAEYPDVDEGIVYPNRILTLLGEEITESDIEMEDAQEGDDDDDDDDEDEEEEG